MTGRWLLVVVTAVALVVTPLVVSARPVADSDIAVVELADRIERSATQGWSGLVDSSGSLQVPDTDSFAGLVQLLGEQNRLRVWWRGEDDWRVDQIRSTGEADLFRSGSTLVRWEFESETATISPVSTIRLPDSSDLPPATLARSMLQGARPGELERLPSRRIAGIVAAGLRLTPAEAASSVGHVDLWADPTTGVAVRVELYGQTDRLPVLVTRLTDLVLGVPDPTTTEFEAGPGVALGYAESTDVAAAANALARIDLPPTLAGLGSRSGADPGAVGVYGRGPTTVIVLPLRGQVAGPLRQRLRDSAAVEQTSLGALLGVGPITLLITPRSEQGSILLAGTVTPATLRQAAAELGTAR